MGNGRATQVSRTIYTARWEGGSPVAGTMVRMKTPEGEYTHPVISPDGREVAFWGIGEEGANIWVGEVASGAVRRVTPAGMAACHPCWSPDSCTLLFAANPDISSDRIAGSPYDADRFAPRGLFTVDREGGSLRLIWGGAHDHERPAWSPTGEELVYVSRRGAARNLWVLDMGTGRERPVTDWPEGTAYRPAWHPSGEWIAFNNKGPGEHQLWLVRPDGRELHRLSPPFAGVPNPETPYWDHGAFWIGGGERLLFHSNRSGEPAIWCIDRDGSGMRQVEMPFPVLRAAHAALDHAKSWMSFDAIPER